MYKLDIYILVFVSVLILGFCLAFSDKWRHYKFKDMQQVVIKKALEQSGMKYDHNVDYLIRVHLINHE